MPILPVEPSWEQNEQEREQYLESERVGGMIEDFIGADFDEESPVPNPSNSQFELGAPNAPLLLNAEITLPSNVSIEEAGRELGPLVERAAREGVARDIENDYDEFVYLPLSIFTKQKKERENLQAPAVPLFGKGELTHQMRPGGWPSAQEWDENRLEVSWGPTTSDDQSPSKKYHDMFFGNPGTGKGHKVKIPRRFPRLSRRVREDIAQIIVDWLYLKQNESAATANSFTDRAPLWTS